MSNYDNLILNNLDILYKKLLDNIKTIDSCNPHNDIEPVLTEFLSHSDKFTTEQQTEWYKSLFEHKYRNGEHVKIFVNCKHGIVLKYNPIIMKLLDKKFIMLGREEKYDIIQHYTRISFVSLNI